MMAGIMHVDAKIEYAINDFAMNESVMSGSESRLFVDSLAGATSRPANRDFCLKTGHRDHDND